MWTASSRPTAALPSSDGSPRIATMPRGSPPGARRPTRSAPATARSPASRCRRASTLRCARVGPPLAARRGRGGVGGASGRRGGRLVWARRVGRREPGPQRDRRGDRRAPALHRGGAPSDRGEGRRKPSQSQWLSRRVGYAAGGAQSRAVRAEAARRAAAAGAGRTRRRALMYESASGERYTFYCRRRPRTKRVALSARAGVVGSYTWVEDDSLRGQRPGRPACLKRVAEAVYEQVETRQQTAPAAPVRRARRAEVLESPSATAAH